MASFQQIWFIGRRVVTADGRAGTVIAVQGTGGNAVIVVSLAGGVVTSFSPGALS